MATSRLIEATCPECRGPLTEVVDDGVLGYRCLVEHRYSPMGLLAGHSETLVRYGRSTRCSAWREAESEVDPEVENVPVRDVAPRHPHPRSLAERPGAG